MDLRGLTGGAKLIVEQAMELAGGHPLGLNHWLKAICQRNGGLVNRLVKDIDSGQILTNVEQALNQNEGGKPVAPEYLVNKALEAARAEGNENAAERHLIMCVLEEAGITVEIENYASFRPVTSGNMNSQKNRSKTNTPNLDKFGTNLVQEAKRGKLMPAVGREMELQLLLETLCRRIKRNPMLVGPAGVGKTAIVEGLALLIANDQVPDFLQHACLYALQPSNLVAGAGYGDLEERTKNIIEEASQDGIILFIDEFHSVIGAGGTPGLSDFATLLKPALARGQVVCIAATTDDEYRRFIESDPALERRFQPVRVQEMNPEDTIQVLLKHRDELTRLKGITVEDGIIRNIVDLARQYLRNRHFPDKGVDLLEQCVAHAMVNKKESVDTDDVKDIVGRMVGITLERQPGFGSLVQGLEQVGILSTNQIESLSDRLAVTMRGLDLHSSRPNALILMLDEAAPHCQRLSQVIAQYLFGSEERLISIDFSRLVNEADLTVLLGAPPGYVGYSERTPLQALAQMPGCVLCWENIDYAHPAVLKVVKNALLHGYIVDARGRNYYLSDTVVVLSTRRSAEKPRNHAIGFQRKDTVYSEADLGIESILGIELARMIDLVCSKPCRESDNWAVWVHSNLNREVSANFVREGINLNWDKSLVQWLVDESAGDSYSYERILDRTVIPAIVKFLEDTPTGVKSILVQYLESRVTLAAIS